MPVVGRAEVLVAPSFSGFQQQAEKQTKPAGGVIARAVGKTLKAGAVIAGAATGTILGTSIVKGFQRLSAIENAKAKLAGLGHSAKDVEAIMGNALKSVKGTAFGLGDAATVAASAVAAGIKPGKQLQTTLDAVANTAAASGSSLSDMGSIFNQVATSNKAYNGSLKQLSDRGLPIYQALAKELGVSSDAVFKLASKGKIDFATFQRAAVSAAGTVAKEMGTTTTGTLDNVGAALGRFGAALQGGIFAHAPAIFGNLITVIDNMTTAVKPLADQLGNRLGVSLEGLTARLARVDFSRIMTGLQGFYRLIAKGDYTGGLSKAFGIEEDSKVVGIILGVRDALIGAFSKIRSFVSGLDFSSWQGFLDSLKSSGGAGSVLSGIGQSIQTLMPAVKEFVAQLPQIGPAMAKLGSAGIQVLSKVLGFLADHIDTIIKWMPAIVAGFVAWRVASQATATAQVGLNAANIASRPVLLASNVARLSAAIIERSTTLAKQANTVATEANTVATNGSRLATLKNLAIMAAQKVALLAQNAVMLVVRGATLAWTGVQWLLNAALSANPIGIVIIAIAALVAGIIIAWKKSETFRQVVLAVWAAVKTAVSVAVDWIVTKAKQLGGWFVRTWQSAVAMKDRLIGAFVAANARIVATVAGLVSRVTGFFGSLRSRAVSLVAGLVSSVVNRARAMAASFISAVSGLVGRASAAFSRLNSAISSRISAVVTTVRGLPGKVLSIITGMGQRMYDAGSNLIGMLARGITAALGRAVGAARGIADKIKGLFGGSPVEYGPLLGWNNGGVGKNLGGMLAQGLLDSRGTVGEAAEALARSVDLRYTLPRNGMRLPAAMMAGRRSDMPATFQVAQMNVGYQPRQLFVEADRMARRARHRHNVVGVG